MCGSTATTLQLSWNSISKFQQYLAGEGAQRVN